MSPLHSFMVTEHQAVNDELRFGLQGLVHSVPPGFATEVVLSAFAPHASDRTTSDRLAHAGTVAAAFMRWGDTLLAANGGVRAAPDVSPWVSQLGYSTTGVFHYNPCDCPDNTNRSACPLANNPLMPGCSTYEDTLVQVKQYADSAGLPYRWWLIDSWWHAFDNNTYFEDTPAQVGQLFPRGLRWLYNQTGLSFGAHWSSTFSIDSPYVNLTGASDWACAGGSCIPRSAAIWRHIFGADSAWGLRTIKVDHLYEAFVGHAGDHPMNEQNASLASSGGVTDVLTDPYLAHEFLGGLAEGAAEHGVDIMWYVHFLSFHCGILRFY